LPFFFHTGDTYSPYAKLKFAHPLTVDEVAVDFPKVNFVLCHLGNPWTVDAAEVVYKNMNVWTDLSGLLVGAEEDFRDANRADARRDAIERIRLAFRYAERPNRFLYGSDWPLAPTPAYVGFIREAIPGDFHEMVFRENARTLFGERLRD
jgi:predicted TIM-barrel fold metal-dependent hydrolase